MTGAVARAAYVHVPFCRHRCGYCNFTLVARRDDWIERYLAALALELGALPAPHVVDTLFFGGGTPTHLSPRELQQLFALVACSFPLEKHGEFSVEANPLDLDEERVETLVGAGVNRLSLGVQSFDDRKLEVLERDHRRGDLGQLFARLRPRFQSLSLDLIFGAPGETLASWRDDLRRAIDAGVDHLSTYGLTWEKGTRFWSRRAQGELESASEDLDADLYAAAIDDLSAAGFEHYEVSNFARPGHRCRHNETYWLGRSWHAVGPGAAKHFDGRRETNHRSVDTWMKRLLAGQSPIAESETLSPETRARERLVFGLRRLEGIDLPSFVEETGYDALALGGAPLKRYLRDGAMELSATNLRLTRAGLFVSDSLWPDLLG